MATVVFGLKSLLDEVELLVFPVSLAIPVFYAGDRMLW
jgi:hypothetical protein